MLGAWKQGEREALRRRGRDGEGGAEAPEKEERDVILENILTDVLPLLMERVLTQKAQRDQVQRTHIRMGAKDRRR